MRSRGGPLTTGPPQGLNSSLPSGACVTTYFPIEESKGMGHDVADI